MFSSGASTVERCSRAAPLMLRSEFYTSHHDPSLAKEASDAAENRTQLPCYGPGFEAVVGFGHSGQGRMDTYRIPEVSVWGIIKLQLRSFSPITRGLTAKSRGRLTPSLMHF